MINNFGQNDLLDGLLQRVGEKLEISKTPRQLVEDLYHSVGAWFSGGIRVLR